MVENNKQEANEHGIVVFGRKKETSDKSINDLAKTEEKKETIAPVKEDEVNLDKQKETDVDKIKDEAEKSKTETTDIDKENKEDEAGKPTFKVIPKKEDETQKAKEEKKETEILSDAKLIEVLNSKGIKITSLNDLSKQETLSDAVSEFKKFNENTGRGINAYYNSKKDWSKEESDTTIREFYKYQDPNSTEEDIDRELELLKLSEEDKEEMSPREIKEVEAKYRRKHSEAVNYMNKIKKDYSLPIEQGKPEPKKELTADEISKMYAPHRANVNKSLEKLNEVSVNFEGLGELKAQLSQEHKDLIYNRTQTEKDYFGAWTKEDGTFDTDKSSLDVAWSIPEIRNVLISEYLIQAHTKMKEQDSKTRRNVTIDSKKEKTPQETKSIMTTFGASESNKMGTPLIPARRN